MPEKNSSFSTQKSHIVAREKHMVTIERASHCHGFQCLLNQHTVHVYNSAVGTTHTHLDIYTQVCNLQLTTVLPQFLTNLNTFFKSFLMTQAFFTNNFDFDRFANEFIICELV